MREIARRAGVSHAAPAHHFTDKIGIFTAVAAEGFRLIADAIAPIAAQPDGFIQGGMAYIRFAIEHRGHFEVMFRPDLHRTTDPDLVAARDTAFRVLYDSGRAAADESDDVMALVVAGWSAAHGFATLLLHANLHDRLGADPTTTANQVTSGLIALGEVARRQRPS
jgi:AcrR family transcriptional regulator